MSRSGPSATRRYWPLIVAIALAGVILDQAAKALAIAFLDPRRPVPFLEGLVTLQLVRNPGAAFSMGEDLTVVFSAIAIVAVIAISVWLVPRINHVGWAVVSGLLLAGILGNLYDRLFREPSAFHGQVVDFIQVRSFAIFNIADIFITVAALLVVWLSLVKKIGLDGVRIDESNLPEPDTK